MINDYTKKILQWSCQAGYISWGGGHILCSSIFFKEYGAGICEIIIADNMEDVGYISRQVFAQMMKESGLSREVVREMIREDLNHIGGVLGLEEEDTP